MHINLLWAGLVSFLSLFFSKLMYFAWIRDHKLILWYSVSFYSLQSYQYYCFFGYLFFLKFFANRIVKIIKSKKKIFLFEFKDFSKLSPEYLKEILKNCSSNSDIYFFLCTFCSVLEKTLDYTWSILFLYELHGSNIFI